MMFNPTVPIQSNVGPQKFRAKISFAVRLQTHPPSFVPLSQPNRSVWEEGEERRASKTSGRGTGGKGLGKGGAKRHWKVLRDNIQGITKPRWCEEDLRADLWGDEGHSQDISDPRCGDLHGAREVEDGDGHGCDPCPREAGENPPWLWRLD